MQLYCLNHTLSTSVLADSPPKQLFRLPVDPAYFPTQCTAARPSHYKVHPYGHSYPTSLWRDLSLTHRESRAGTTQGQNHILTEIRWHLGTPQVQPAVCRSNQTGLLSTLWSQSLGTTRNALQDPSAWPLPPVKTHLLGFPPDGALSSTAASLLLFVPSIDLL